MTGDIAALDDRLGYLLKAAYRGLAEIVDAALVPFGVTARQLALLSVIARDRALSQIALSERLGVDRTTIVAMLDVLEAQGWVERRRDPQDRRRNVLTLTDAGAAHVVDAEKARAAAEAAYLAVLGEGDAGRFLASLRTLIAAGPASQAT